MTRLGTGGALRQLALMCAIACLLGCPKGTPRQATGTEEAQMTDTRPPQQPTARADDPSEEGFTRERLRMVTDHLISRYGIADRGVLEAMRRVPRHRFVPRGMVPHAYDDGPLPIGREQTISQPYIVARMTELAHAEPGHKALDVGTGSGYQAAVLAEVVDHVYSIEILCPLADDARGRLTELGYRNVTVRCGDGYRGWPEEAPFDVIIVAAAPEAIPSALIDQLAPGGRLVIPVGPQRGAQVLTIVERDEQGNTRRFDDGLVRFVPMTGEARSP